MLYIDMERAAQEYDLLLNIASAARELVNECAGQEASLPPSLGAMAELSDALHARWKFLTK